MLLVGRSPFLRTASLWVRPDDIRFTGALPKTRSGKIMRRLLKEVVSGGIVKGDTTTLDDLTVLAQLAASSSSDDD